MALMKLDIQESKFTKVSEIEIPDIFYNRMRTGIEQFDNMFGDGILPGSAFTVTAAAGCGKTTLLLQLMEALANNGYDVGYASGEENRYQLAFTCKRLNVKSVQIANLTDIDSIAEAMKGLDAIVIDSFQALTTKTKMNSHELERYAVTTLVKAAKENECALFFVMHLTKNGDLRGSTLVPHCVDVNLKISTVPDGETHERVIDIYKNRFGVTGEYAAIMTVGGIEITNHRIVSSTPSKTSRKKQLIDDILKLDPPKITKQLIISKFNLTSSQAYLILKEMQECNMIKKYGRGENSVWKRIDVMPSNS